MRVEVRHALADDVVDGDEGPGSTHSGGNANGQALNEGEERLHELSWKIGERFVMDPRYQQGMTREDWTDVEERLEALVLVNHVSGGPTRRYGTEGAHEREP